MRKTAAFFALAVCLLGGDAFAGGGDAAETDRAVHLPTLAALKSLTAAQMAAYAASSAPLIVDHYDTPSASDPYPVIGEVFHVRRGTNLASNGYTVVVPVGSSGCSDYCAVSAGNGDPVRPEWFGAIYNNTDAAIEARNRAALYATLQYSPAAEVDVCGTLHLSHSGKGGAVLVRAQQKITGCGIGAAAIVVHLDTPYAFAFDVGFDGVVFRSIKLKTDYSGTPYAGAIIYTVFAGANDITFDKIDWDGSVTSNGSTISYGSRLVLFANAAPHSNLTVRNSRLHDGDYVFSNANTSKAVFTGLYAIDNDVYNFYGEPLSPNFPKGSLSTVVISGNHIHNALPAGPASGLDTHHIAIGVATGSNVKIVNNVVDTGPWYVCVNLEQDVRDFAVTGNTCLVPHHGIHILPSNVEQPGYLHPVNGLVSNNVVTQTGRSIAPDSMGIGDTRASSPVGTVTAGNVSYVGNRVTGPFVFGFYSEAAFDKGTRFSGNTADGSGTCFYIRRGGAGVSANTSRNCTAAHLAVDRAYLKSHTFVSTDPTRPFAQGGTQAPLFSGFSKGAQITIDAWTGEFGPVPLSAGESRRFELFAVPASDNASSVSVAADAVGLTTGARDRHDERLSAVFDGPSALSAPAVRPSPTKGIASVVERDNRCRDGMANCAAWSIAASSAQPVKGRVVFSGGLTLRWP